MLFPVFCVLCFRWVWGFSFLIEIALFALASLVLFIPGLALSFAVLNGTSLRKFDKALFGIVLGLIAVPLLSFLEFLFLGLHLNVWLVVFNSLLVLFASLAYLNMVKGISFKLPSFSSNVSKEDAISFLKKNWAYILLIAIMAFGFYVRFSTSWTSTFFEFDPYYYNKLTERLVQNGFLTTYTSDAYFPLQAFQRYAPMIHYLVGSWDLLYNAIASAAYSKENLILISGFYPPLVGALLSFLAFILVREEFNDAIALVPAAFLAITPQLIQKFAAGVAEQQPWGVFTALLIFAAYALALKTKSLRVGVLTGLALVAAVLGSQQHLWPFMLISVYIGLQACLDFVKGKFDKKLVYINAIVAASGFAGNVLLSLYQEGVYTQLVTNATASLAVGFLFSLVLYLIHLKAPNFNWKKRLAVLTGLLLLSVALITFTPLYGKTLGPLFTSVNFATTGSALSKTIAEEGQSTQGLWQSSFGVLDPLLLLKLSALLSVGFLLVGLYLRKKNKLAIAALAASAVLFLFANQLDDLVLFIANLLSNQDLVLFSQVLTAQGDIFVYMLLAIAGVALSFLFSEEDNRAGLLFVLIFFPIAFIGLNKLKYLLHMGFALCLASGFVLGQAYLIVEKLNKAFHATKDSRAIPTAFLGLLLLTGAVAASIQLTTVDRSMNELKVTRLPVDWSATFDWMKSNLPSQARIMSWWDYGHWTTFLGERNTVIDPNNAHANFDQGVAQGFVDGNTDDLYKLMSYHNATHVMVDWELINKWGALVFLSGSCEKSAFQGIPGYPDICPETAGIPDWRKGAGRSLYETDHSFEILSVAGNCPQSVSPIALPALRSNFGAVYCLTETEMILLTQSGLNSSLKRPYKVIGRDEIKEVDPNTTYLQPYQQQGTFVNPNPFLEPYGLKSNLINSAYVRLFFFNQLPGFNLIYTSPNSGVKIFEYTKNAN